MPFITNGMWSPAPNVGNSMGIQAPTPMQGPPVQGGANGGVVPPPQFNSQMQPSVQQQFPQFNSQMQQPLPQFNAQQMMNAPRMPQMQPPYPPTQQSQQQYQPQYQQQQQPMPWQQQQQQQLGAQPGWGGSQFGVAQGQSQMAPQPSVEQGVQGSNPQSIQNFMSALHQVGAGSNNSFMNGQGQQGAAAQAGFQGFGQNGYQGMVGQGQGAGPTQFMNSNIQNGGIQNGGFQQNGGYGMTNQASVGSQYTSQNNAMQGTYGQQLGNQGQGGQMMGHGTNTGQNPQWQTPQPWGNPQNAPPGQQGSLYGSAQQYFNTQNTASAQPGTTQPGSFYSWVQPGAPTNGSVSSGPTTVSDVRAKENIKDANKELEDFLNALNVYSYEYKDKADGEGRYVSPMAQELEKSELGKSMVVERSDGKKTVDYARGFGTMLASQALLNHKYKQLEKKLTNAVLHSLNQKRKK